MLSKIAIAAAAVVAGGVWTSSAHAIITETESNNTIATANSITRPGSGLFADVGVPTLGASDVDVFSLALNAGELLTFNAAPLNITGTTGSPDTAIALINSSGTILAVNDDIGPTAFGSAIQFLASTSGTYYLAVSGTDDVGNAAAGGTFGSGNFTGAHPETGAYAITVSTVPVPEPTSLALLGGLALLGVRRPRRA